MLSYGVIGVLSASTDAGIFWLLITYAGLPPQLANVVGIGCGITMSFWLNRAFTFGVRDRALARFAIFWGVGLIGLALSALVLEVGLRLGYPAMNVKLFSVVVVAAAQFVLNRSITFRSKGTVEAGVGK
jgi:putative flippase GtrA